MKSVVHSGNRMCFKKFGLLFLAVDTSEELLDLESCVRAA